MSTGRDLGQRADLTYKANIHSGRHGWLRLTPAYSMSLVRSKLERLGQGSLVLEPFSGSGTTPLTAQELGLRCEAREINPFLVWFGNVKLSEYDGCSHDYLQSASHIISAASDSMGSEFWRPDIHQIEKWWNAPTLDALSSLKYYIGETSGKIRDLLDVAFCRVMISCSNASFNHQSMSFKQNVSDDPTDYSFLFRSVINHFRDETDYVAKSLEDGMRRTAFIRQGDSTTSFAEFEQADLIITSPPYANRMSYIRELRPYMYWLKFLSSGAEAGELDWQTTGGTWGSASSRVKTWSPDSDYPIMGEVSLVCESIAKGKSGDILAPYVSKYFYDMWNHFVSITPCVKSGGEVCYIVGNSAFSGIEVPTQRWYAEMLAALGYGDVKVDVIRKRNSNKQLFEYAVSATRR